MKYNKLIIDKPEFINRIKAPEGIKNTIMNSIYKLGIIRHNPAEDNLKMCSARLFRRLGFSMVITACILIISLFIPFTNNYQSYISKSVNSNIIKHQPPKFTQEFTGIENGIKDMFCSITGSIGKIKEGR
ncbi:MAG: hypothetical protein Q8920_14090 [Bacillota bacterium]|nr:hypothetical protein [Bacillota bacterium]